MNVIAWDTAFCLYPRATLLDRVALVIHPVIPLDTPAVRKYAERGYRLFNAPHAYQRAQLAPVFFPDALRWVDDARGWAVPLSTAGLVPPPLSATSAPIARDPVAHNSWTLRSAGRSAGTTKRVCAWSTSRSTPVSSGLDTSAKTKVSSRRFSCPS
jgi:hypothetical protein